MPRSRTVLPGSLVDGLLSDLAAEQRAVPELAGQLKLDELRWNLDPARFRHSADANVAAAASAAVDRAAVLQALRGCSDETLETLLECSAEWHCVVRRSAREKKKGTPALALAPKLLMYFIHTDTQKAGGADPPVVILISRFLSYLHVSTYVSTCI